MTSANRQPPAPHTVASESVETESVESVAVDSDTDGGVCHVAIVHAPIDVGRVTSFAEHAGVGAVSIFLGTVRRHNDGRSVTGIEYEAYQPMAEKQLHLIATEVAARYPGLRIAIEHRVGTLHVGDVSVAIAAGHARRAPALAGAQEVIELLKVRVPIWKLEHYVDGERVWIDPTRPPLSATLT